ncbi:hypothetical protein [Shewanella woodyi]|uniref:Curlin associated repeat-containing protein n=1 Tax=Shewanella woodyi (strain ATCC 51908 / MS32) TaxID=392500 RepID=B1KH70_SHEWM|nr:hypothetical protein [Shewanella woodyi]ACA88382.1 conserved hypothetical protein [Shewanella woodyi ATCC 51908]
MKYLWMACLCTAVAVPLEASELNLDFTNNKLELPDEVLATMRGKYTQSGQDYYFGLQMRTQYLTAQGVSRQVQMQVELSLLGDSPAVVVSIEEPVTVSDGSSVSLTSLGQQTGLQQKIQIAGDQNRALNDMDIGEGRLQALGGAQFDIGQTLISGDGHVVFSTQPGGLGYQVSLPGGSATQGVVINNGNGQLIQSINIGGAFHGVSNQAMIRYQGVDIASQHNQLMAQHINDLIVLGL